MASLYAPLVAELEKIVGPKRARSLAPALGMTKNAPEPDVRAFYIDTSAADAVCVYAQVQSSLVRAEMTKNGDYLFTAVPLSRLRRVSEQFAGRVLTVVVEVDAEPVQLTLSPVTGGDGSGSVGVLRYAGWLLSAPADNARRLAMFAVLLRANML